MEKKLLLPKLNLQFFAEGDESTSEPGLHKTGDFAKVQSIDFVEMFGENLSKLIEALNVTRKQPVPSGMTLKRYKSKVTMANTNEVAEGEIIPLSKVETEEADPIVLTFQKYRKAVTAEAIQKHGYDQAVVMTDQKLLFEIQKGVRASLFTHLADGTTEVTAKDLKAAFAKAWGNVQVLFEDDAAQTVAFVNPLDVADYIAEGTLTTQTLFGLQYAQNFAGVDTVIINSSVPRGTVYATAPENIVLAYVQISGGELGRAFDFTLDELGLIGVTHAAQINNLTQETVALSGIKFFAERLDGVVVITIGEGEEENPEV